MKRPYDKLSDKLLIFQKYLDSNGPGFSSFIVFEVTRTLCAHIKDKKYSTMLKDLMEIQISASKGSREIYQVYSLIEIINKIIEGQKQSIQVQRTILSNFTSLEILDFDMGNNFNGFASSLVLSQEYDLLLDKIDEKWKELTDDLKIELEKLLFRNY